jgi:hypothetical protein
VRSCLKTKQKSQAWWLKPLILTTREVEIRSLRFKDSLGQKFARTCLNQWLDVVECACHSSFGKKKHKKENYSPSLPGISESLSQK